MSGDGGMVPVTRDVVGERLIEIGAITQDQLLDARNRAARLQRTSLEILLQDGAISRSDAVEAATAGRVTLQATKLDELPEWDEVVGHAIGAPPPSALVITSRADARKRAFLVSTDQATTQRCNNLLSEAIGKGGLKLAGRVTLNQNLLDLIISTYASHGRAAASSEETALQTKFDEIGLDAFTKGASDIHLTVLDGRGTVYYRIHGELEHQEDFPAEYMTALCRTAYNTLAEDGSTKEGFNELDKQDAVIERKFPQGKIRFRYSGVPLAPSPSFDVTLRVIPIGVVSKRLTMEQLGYSADQCAELDRIFSHSSGLILFAGTTGSGKSTSMANSLWRMAEERPGKKIRTIEEPVESRIPGTYQSPVVRKSNDGSDFTTMLRQLMRADPDIIAVGEIRDKDTAELSIQAVRSGHLCVSTIHADGAPICYDRLVGMGIQRADLASVGLVQGLIYQKLLQVLCQHCKVPHASYAESHAGAPIVARVERAYGGVVDGIYYRSESGCSKCRGRGITTRTVAAEILRPTPSMLRAVAEGDSPAVWEAWRSTIDKQDKAVMRGRTAFEHAKHKVASGLVCPNGLESEFHFIDEVPYAGDEH